MGAALLLLSFQGPNKTPEKASLAERFVLLLTVFSACLATLGCVNTTDCDTKVLVTYGHQRQEGAVMPIFPLGHVSQNFLLLGPTVSSRTAGLSHEFDTSAFRKAPDAIRQQHQTMND